MHVDVMMMLLLTASEGSGRKVDTAERHNHSFLELAVPTIRISLHGKITTFSSSVFSWLSTANETPNNESNRLAAANLSYREEC